MSNHLALATVTAALAYRVQGAAQTAVGGTSVVTGRPGGSDSPAGQRRIHVCLYHVTPSAALRRADLFSREARGQPGQPPPVAVDLYYLLACYGDEGTLEPERMLAAVIHDLHVRPALTGADIEQAMAGHPELSGSDPAGAADAVRLTPVALSLDELATLWSVLSPAPHALTVMYQTTVLLGVGEQKADIAGPGQPLR